MKTLTLSDVSLRGRARWHSLVAVIVSIWVLFGVGALIGYHQGWGVSWWDVIHPFTIGVATTAIIVYSTHFTEALTRSATNGYGSVACRVGLVNLALVALIVDRAGFDWGVVSDIAAATIIGVLLWHLVIITRLLQGSLSGRFAVTVPFYLAATSFLILAVTLVIASGRVGNYSDLIAAHSRAAIWGFAWLTILGTVVTLIPTLTATRISPVALRRCPRALTVHCTGLVGAVVFEAVGLARLAGMSQLLVVVAAAMIVQPILAGIKISRTTSPRVTTSSVSTSAGLVWMIAVCAGDAASGIFGADPRAITLHLAPVFIGAGLIQLVLGVLHQLLPTLIGGGGAKVKLGMAVVDRGGAGRMTLLNLGAIIVLFGASLPGIVLMALAALGHVIALLRAGMVQYRAISQRKETK